MKATIIAALAAALVLVSCAKKPSGPTTGDGIPVDMNQMENGTVPANAM